MHKILLCVAMLLLASFPRAQNTCVARLLKNSGEIKAMPANAEKIKSAGYSYSATEIIVKTADNRKLVLPSNTVWGYQDKDCAFYRNFKGGFFKIEQQGDMIIYSRQSNGFRSRLFTRYFFSKGLDTEIFALDKADLLSEFRDNGCFTGKLKQRFTWPFDYAYWNKNKNSYEVVEILHECR